jgi:hypothetical protein
MMADTPNLHKTMAADDKLASIMTKLEANIAALKKAAAAVEKPTMFQVRMVEQASKELEHLATDLHSRQRVR